MNVRKENSVSSKGWKFGRGGFPGIGKFLRAMLPFLLIGFGAVSANAMGVSSNLIVNGSFDEGLKGWHYEYKLNGESWYNDNDKFVSVVAQESGHRNVLALKTLYDKAMVPGQGVKVDSFPVPIDAKSGARYRLTVSARTTAPDCRILLEGYKWKPGIKPHDNPDMSELRKEYKFAQVFFTTGGKGGAKAVTSRSSGTLTGKKTAVAEENGGSGDFGGVKGQWMTGSVTFPDEKMTELAKGMYSEVKFVILHIVGIVTSSEGKNYEHREDCYLYVDDVKLEQIK